WIDEHGVLWMRRGANQGAGDLISYFRSGPANDDLWRRTERLIDETLDVVTAAKMPYLPFLIPTNVEVGGTNWKALGWPGATPPSDVDLNLPFTRMTTFFRNRGIKVVDLSPHLKDPAIGSASYYYPQDGHWNAAGQAAAARVLAGYVENLVSRTPER